MQTDISTLTDRELDKRLAVALGLNVVDGYWPCWQDIETGCWEPHLSMEMENDGDSMQPVYRVRIAVGRTTIRIVPFWTTNPNDSDGLLDEMESRGWRRVEEAEGDSLTRVMFWHFFDGNSVSTTRLRARTEAALRALEAEKAGESDSETRPQTH